MNPKVAAILQALAPALEAAVADVATVAAGPVVGAAVTMGEQVLNAAVGINVPVAPTAGAVKPVVVVTADVPKVEAATVGVTPAVAGMQSVSADPAAHPLLIEAGRAPLVAVAHPSGTVPAEDDMNFPDIYARLAALESKLNALVNATGNQGSAAMAAHP
jgi:hypothetical protein